MSQGREFDLLVRDLPEVFEVEVRARGRRRILKVLPWHGGDFTYKDELYEVRGPYHGLGDYQVYRLQIQEASVQVERLPDGKHRRGKRRR